MVMHMNFTSLGSLAGLSATIILAALLYELAIYIYTALAMMKIADKTKVKTPKWFAWIPILNLILMVDEAGLPTVWTLAFLVAVIPFVGGILVLIFSLYLLWKIAENVKKPGWYSLLSLIPIVGPFLTWGLIAWGK